MAYRRSQDENERRTSLGCLIWIFGAILIALVFFLKWPEIQLTLERSGVAHSLKARFSGTTTTLMPVPSPSRQPVSRPGVLSPEDLLSGSQDDGTEIPGPFSTPKPTTTTLPSAEGTEPPAAEKPKRNLKLYFVRVDDDGIITRQEVARETASTGSPLSDAIRALLSGPSEEELRRNLVSLIPPGAVLRSARILGSTAVLDFNEAFMYNKFGIEGYAAQLKQVVYTATTFATVQDVQILIEGKNRDFLGGEGVYIGRPLSRNSF